MSYKWPENLDIGILPGLPLTGARKWAALLASDAGMKVRIIQATDSAGRIKLSHNGIIGLGSDEARRVLEKDGRYASRDSSWFQLRLAWVHSRYYSGFMVRGDSPINDVCDIKPGVRVVDMRSYLGSQHNIDGLLAWAGVDDSDVAWIKSERVEEKARLISDGKADLAWAIPTSPSVYQAEQNPHGLRWLDLDEDSDPEGAGRFREKYVCGFGPMLRGVPSCIGRWGIVTAGLFCCRADAKPEFVYHLAKWSDENYARYRGLPPGFLQTARENLAEELCKTFMPCHDGLIVYLKEFGLWSRAHEKRQKENVGLVNSYCQANKEAIEKADARRIRVSGDNPEWVELWEAHKKDAGLPRFKLCSGAEEN